MLKFIVHSIIASLLALFGHNAIARADIFEWEYVNPANPGLGKQQSTTLAPGGAGVNAVPGANLANRNLTKAYLIGANLSTGTYYDEYGNEIGYTAAPDLSGTNLSQADLTNAICLNANFTGAILTDAEVRGANFTGSGLITLAQLYSTASYKAHDLTGISLGYRNLTNANLVGQNLTSARFHGATMNGANLNGAVVHGTDFSRVYDQQSSTLSGGITPSQLYLTASYLAHDLRGMILQANDFANIDLANQYLGGASFRGISFGDEGGGYTIGTNLSGANLSGAGLAGADFYGASLHGANLSQAKLMYANFSGDYLYDAYSDLTNANLSGADARGANFLYATLTGANFTNADVRGADFHSSDVSAAQIYSSTSYKTHDLTGIGLAFARLAGMNLASQNLTNADFQYATLANSLFSQANLTNARFRDANLTNVNFSYANLSNANFTSDHSSYSDFTNLTDANLSHANLTNADFSGSRTYYTEDGVFTVPDANLTNANLSGADARGANFQDATLAGANTARLIQANGRIAGLSLTAGNSLAVRDYDGNPAASPPTGPLPIVVDGHLAMSASGKLELVFDADPWDSTISFAPGISVTLGGALELAFAPDVDLASQLGRTIDLFDWTGVTPMGAFSVSSPFTWNLSQLYTTGEVTLTAAPGILPGDFNGNGVVDTADYVVWRNNDGTQAGYDLWRAHFGQTAGSGAAEYPLDSSARTLSAGVPEPSTCLLVIMSCFAIALHRKFVSA